VKKPVGTTCNGTETLKGGGDKGLQQGKKKRNPAGGSGGASHEKNRKLQGEATSGNGAIFTLGADRTKRKKKKNGESLGKFVHSMK